METRILKVVQCGEVVAVPSQKAEGGQMLQMRGLRVRHSEEIYRSLCITNSILS